MTKKGYISRVKKIAEEAKRQNFNPCFITHGRSRGQLSTPLECFLSWTDQEIDSFMKRHDIRPEAVFSDNDIYW